MRFAILGAGAIGAYVGAALARGGAEVVLIARGAHLAAIQARGVRVLSPRGDFDVKVEATDSLEPLRTADVAFIALKAHSLPEMAKQIGASLGPRTAVVAAQNGLPWWYFQSYPGPLSGTVLESVDPGGLLQRAIEPERVIGCVVFPATEIAEPGVIRHIEGTRLALGEPNGSISERCERIAGALQAGGLKCNIDASLRDEIWLKLIGNAAFNPVSAITRANLGELGTRPGMLALLHDLMCESATVAERLGTKLRVSLERRLEAGVQVGPHKTSMLQDLESGKRLESACMTGAIIELAELLGIEVSRTRAIHACLEMVEQIQSGTRLAPPAQTGS